MKIESSKLQRIFKYLTPSIGSPLKLPEYNSFLFDANETGLMVRIYNGVIESIVNMEGEFEPIRFAVDEFIYQVVKNLNGEITFELNDNTLMVDCGPKHYEFSTVDCELWQPIVNANVIEPFDLELVRAFNKVSHAAATDDSRPIYNGYHIKNGQLFTSDGFRAIIIPINMDDYSFPKKEFDSILRCLDGVVYYKFDDGIYFRCESDEFEIKYMTAKLDGDTFDCEKIFKEKESIETKATIIFDNLVDDLKDVIVLQQQAKKLGESSFLLSIFPESDDLYFYTNITGLSNSKQKIDCELVELDDFVIHVNPLYLMDYAKVADGKIIMKILGEMEPILLLDESEAKSLLMPMNKKE